MKPYTSLLESGDQLFFFSENAREYWPQSKDFGGRYGFLGFHRLLVSTTGLESFLFF